MGWVRYLKIFFVVFVIGIGVSAGIWGIITLAQQYPWWFDRIFIVCMIALSAAALSAGLYFDSNWMKKQ